MKRSSASNLPFAARLDIAALLDSPFFDVWARAGIAEIVSALHERLVTTPRP